MSLIRKTILKSGIKVITEEMPDVESSSIGIWVNTGSRDEAAPTNGISHFIEHMLFKGTKRRTALDISREIESVGGVLNAFTGREYTCFYAKVLNKDVALAIDLLSDIFLNSKFDSVEMEKEKLVVLQEIKMVEDTPDDLVHDLFAERFWRGDPLGWSVLGTAGKIKAVTRKDIKGYFRERYISGNVIVTAAGGLSHKKVVRLLGPTLGAMARSAAPKPPAAPAPYSGYKLFRKDLEQVHLCLGVPVPPQASPEKYKVYLLNTVLGAGMSSRLFQEIREKRGLAYSVYSYLNLCKDAGSLITYAGTSKDGFAEVASLILREFGKMRKSGVSAGELRDAKEQLKGGMILVLETSDSRMTKLARDEIYFGREIPVKEIVREVDRVTPAQIKAAAGKYLKPEDVTLVAIGKVGPRGLPASIKKLN